ncbi:hypothetical protein LEP1GSC163_1664 [Leptospira santarosai str. CBC379]|uniref:Uncharacterized protein n=5 Tax=Leptospira santarosai TaxID=28183 RepID=A0A0E2BFE9_9LEPT|nr:hypothetical protein LEP1GSC179_2161 [Leptospira santarosai str. MOR084]EKR90560.1 hypothetical protein LEP1GSC163_1664 [Leptospira santarosai str. CBC379]EMN22926.1 hypothetical protein LEP1GSC063_0600 [Leptospira santarosai serovar Arenal str. MAVJ 401]
MMIQKLINFPLWELLRFYYQRFSDHELDFSQALRQVFCKISTKSSPSYFF